MTDDQKYLLDKNFTRIDNFLSHVNTKAAFIIAFNTFVLGGVLLKANDTSALFKHYPIQVLAVAVLFVMVVGIGLSTYRTLEAMAPYLGSGNNSATGYHTLFFFGSIADLPVDDYEKRVGQLTPDELLHDMVQQTHVLSRSLIHKFQKIAKGVWWATYFVCIPLFSLAGLKLLDLLLS